jgi:hypothetical protein
MGSRSTKVAVALSVLAAGGAAGCFVRVAQLRIDGKWLMARSDAQAGEYSTTLDSAMAEAQLATLEVRRRVLERAYSWQRAEMLLILLAVVAAFCAYVLYLYHGLREQLSDEPSPDELRE